MKVYRVTGAGREEHVQVVAEVLHEVAQAVKRVWVEEFGGGGWVEHPVQPVLDPDTVAREALNGALYGPAYQGTPASRGARGIWTNFRGQRG